MTCWASKVGDDHVNENLSINNGRLAIGGGANLVVATPASDGGGGPLLVSKQRGKSWWAR